MIQRPFRNVGQEILKALAKLSPAARDKMLAALRDRAGAGSIGAGVMRWGPDADPVGPKPEKLSPRTEPRGRR